MGDPVILTSPITVNTTLKNLGFVVDYIYEGNNLLQVENNAVLTIEPGVNIQFTHTGKNGGMRIRGGATLKAIGTDKQRIKFLGTNNEKGSWAGITIETNSDNQLAYCDLVNAGNTNRSDYAGLSVHEGKVGIQHCKFTNGLGYGIRLSSMSNTLCVLSAFSNNVVEDYETPVIMSTRSQMKLLESFDMTSDFTKNKNRYIELSPSSLEENVVVNQTTVPYFFNGGYLNLRSFRLTINEGVTIYMSSGQGIESQTGTLIINGTPSKKVKFTRLPDGGSYYWRSIACGLPGSVIKNCIFEYGGQNGTYDAIMMIDRNAELTLENVEINNSQNYGVHLRDCNLRLIHTNVTFSGNGKAAVYDYCPSPHTTRDRL
jgi:hypothetical protein